MRGDKEVSLDMEFITKDRKQESKCLSGTFHDAEIEDEMILGYPWVTQNKLAIILALGALQTDNGKSSLLAGWPDDVEEDERQKEHNKPVSNKIRKMRLQVPEEGGSNRPTLQKREPDWLGTEEMHEVDQKQGPEHTSTVRATHAEGGEWGEHQPLVHSLREKLFADFPMVLRKTIRPNTPVRGDNCEAEIPFETHGKTEKTASHVVVRRKIRRHVENHTRLATGRKNGILQRAVEFPMFPSGTARQSVEGGG